jgi:glycine/D-amino acid oxidase-like deaminating enzyme
MNNQSCAHRSYEVIVLGGGSLGLWTALFLAAAGVKVLVIERREDLGLRSTFVNAGFGNRMAVCNHQIRALAEVSAAVWEAPPVFFRGELWAPVEVLHLISEQDYDAKLLSLTQLAEKSGAVWRKWSREEIASSLAPVREDLRVGCIAEKGMRFSLPTILHGLAKAIEWKGGAILTGAFLFGVDRADTGGFVLHTTFGNLYAPVVVDATGSMGDATGGLFGSPSINLRPMKHHRIKGRVTETERMMPDGLVMIDDSGFYWAFQPDDDVTFGSGEESACDPRDLEPELPVVQAMMKRLDDYAGLSLSTEHPISISAGHRPIVADRVPVLSADPAVPGLYRALAPGGYGVQCGPAIGRLMAALVLDGKLPPAFARWGVSFETYSLTRFTKKQTPQSERV